MTIFALEEANTLVKGFVRALAIFLKGFACGVSLCFVMELPFASPLPELVFELQIL
jgi:hypothetical protein